MRICGKKRAAAAALAVLTAVCALPVYAQEGQTEEVPVRAREGYAEEVLLSAQEGQTETAYQARRVIVFAEAPADYYGALEAEYLPAAGCWILSYATEEETQAAFARLSETCDCVMDEILEADEVLESMSWGSAYMGFDAVAEAGICFSEEVVVAVVDTGFGPFDATELFAGRVLPGYDFAEDDADVTDDGILDRTSISYGHGTHVAGIVAGCTPSNVKILPIKIFQNNQSSSSLIIQAVAYALDQGADVINLSLGVEDPNQSKSFLNPLIEKAKETGCVICCAAGNKGEEASRLYPSNHADTVAVSAIRRDGQPGYSFSNYGPEIDFCAPGADVNSTMPGNTYASKTGTSQAAPHVSAAFAVIRSAFPDCGVQELYNMAVACCDDLGTPGRDDYCGNGCIRVDRFLDYWRSGAIDPSGNPEGGGQDPDDWPFTDVAVNADDWVWQAANYVYTNGIMTGMDETTFGPAFDVSRAQFATILYRMNGEPPVSGKSVFPDVAAGLWYSAPVVWAADAGVVTGYQNGMFGPADYITREQLCVMMYRYARSLGLVAAERASISAYPDAGNVSDWAEEAVEWTVGSGIVSGKDGGKRLDPAGYASRAECATIIMRFCEYCES